MISAKDAKMYTLECAMAKETVMKEILSSIVKGNQYCICNMSDEMAQILKLLGYSVKYYDLELCYRIDWE